MISAGIRELKTHLSTYVRKVKAGETVQITEHGKGVAFITLSAEQTEERRVLEQMARDGLVILGNGGRPKGGSLKYKLKKGAKLTSEIILEDRKW